MPCSQKDDLHTHFIIFDSPWLVAVTTGGFIRVPEQQVNEVNPAVHLNQIKALSNVLEVEVFIVSLRKSCIYSLCAFTAYCQITIISSVMANSRLLTLKVG